MCDSQPDVAALIRQWSETLTMRTMRAWWSHVRASGLSMPQFGVLMFLYHGGSCGVNDVGERMDVSGAAASQLIERLVQAGLVERTENPDDRRARLIALSARGRALVEQGTVQRYLWLDQLVALLDPEHRQAVLTALPYLIDAESALRVQDLQT
jgi:DNA-binding MarR family transcriptional regulator